ncbi:hypothetical protein E2C01_040172 [Portunus trituberculatus]|uniref:Uncharacterized protein n=1 Tax=Portunus trituberculatus TaxID=210409 RepID=A0A5B7FIZ1_PORTR|nr:hypothetical protein [Portunus trituberculatus]
MCQPTSASNDVVFNQGYTWDMMSFPRLRDSRDFSHYSSSAEWADKDKTSSFALSEADVAGSADVIGTTCLNE